MSAAAQTRPVVDTTVAIAVTDAQLRGQVLEARGKIAATVIEENCPAANLEELVAAIERLRPSILFLGLPGLPSDPVLALERIAKLDSAPRIVVVSDSADPETILKVIRAGAAEFVYPPFQSGFEEAMHRVLTLCLRSLPNVRASGQILGFVSAKGGCGATTVACHAASHLRLEAKKEVLLADFDMCSGITGLLMQTEGRYSLDDAVQNLHRMDLKLWKALVSTSSTGVDVIPAPPEPSANFSSLSRKLPQLLRFWREQYDLTILDLGHGMTQTLVEVLESVDTLVLVTTNELPALRQAKQMIQALALRNFGANRLKLVINRMPKRAEIQLPELEKVMGHPIYAALPNDYRIVSEAYAESKLIEPDSNPGMHIGRLAIKLAGLAPVENKRIRKLFGFGKK